MRAKTEKPLIGFASSMFQTSGSLCGDSNWTEAADNGTVPSPDQSVPHWNNFESDLDLLQDVGINTYRISIEWSHIEPFKGEINHHVLAKYEKLIDACLRRNIQPMLTLYHFNEPKWFTHKGSFENKENIQDFVDHCKFVFQRFSHKVKLWCTINEPAVQAFMGYFLGKFPPHISVSFKKTVVVLGHLLQAHVEVYHALKELPEGTQSQIGIVHNVLKFKPLYSYNPIAYFITNLFNPITNELVMSFFKSGTFHYSECMDPKVNFEDLRAPDANDFFGLNFYANPVIGPNCTNGYGPTANYGQVMGDMYLPLDPEGLSDALDQVAALNKPIYITETGVADKNDQLRQQLLVAYFKVIDQKVDEGMAIKGVYLWTPFDNYEWNEGNTKSFGFFDAERNPRESVNVLRKIICDKNAMPSVDLSSLNPELCSDLVYDKLN